MQTGVLVGANGIEITERVLSDTSWPSDFTLDLRKSNWHEWHRQTELLAIGQGFRAWLEGSLPCPDEQQDPAAHWVWKRNDDSLRGFLLSHISPADFALVNTLTTSYETFETLRKRHEDRGLHTKVNLLIKAFNVRFDHNTPLSDTIAVLRQLHYRIIKMGNVDDDEWLIFFLVNAFGDQFPHLQSTIQTISTYPGFSSASVMHCIEAEWSLIQRRTEQGLRPSTVLPTAFPTLTTRKRRPKPACANCKRAGHKTNFCVAPGGKMHGRTLEEAKAAQKAALARASVPLGLRPQGQSSNNQTNTGFTPQSAHITTTQLPPANTQPCAGPTAFITPASSGTDAAPLTININGIQYIQKPKLGLDTDP